MTFFFSTQFHYFIQSVIYGKKEDRSPLVYYGTQFENHCLICFTIVCNINLQLSKFSIRYYQLLFFNIPHRGPID